MRKRTLVENCVHVGAKPCRIEGRSAREEGERLLDSDKATLADRRQLADRNTVTGGDERLTVVDGEQDRAAVVSQLALSDSGSSAHRSTRATREIRVEVSCAFAIACPGERAAGGFGAAKRLLERGWIVE